MSETPIGHKYYIFAPFKFQIDLGEETFENCVRPNGQHYQQGIRLLEGTNRDNPTCRLDILDDVNDFLGIIRANENQDEKNAGPILMTGHGNTERYGVEVYDNTQAGSDKAWDAVLIYWARFNCGVTEISVGTDKQDGYYTVAVSRTFVSEHAELDGSKAILYQAICDADDWLSTWTGEGVRFAVGPVGEVYPSRSKQAVELFSECLNGHHGITRRMCSFAAVYASGQTEDLDLTTEGNGLTVLAPAVKDWLPKEAACTDADAYVEFDCTMDTNQTNVVSGEGCVNVENVLWDGDHKITFDLSSGTGDTVTITVHAQKALSANNSAIRLDGNTLPEGGENAVGPNQDDFVWTVACDCSGCPARVTATIDGVGSGECENCFRGFYGAYYHPCTDLNGSCFLYREAGECNWTAGMPGFQEFTLSRDGDTWHFTVEGRDRAVWRTCASWTAPNTTCCPPNTGWTWDGGCCSEGTLELSW